MGDWRGVNSLKRQLDGKVFSVSRPKWFYKPDSDLPERVRCRFHRLPGFEHLSRSDYNKMLRTRVRAVEKLCADRRTRAVLGDAVLRVTRTRAPTTHEERRQIRPRVAAKCKHRRIHMLSERRAFEVAHSAARLAFSYDPDVDFPPGTNLFSVKGLIGPVGPPGPMRPHLA